MPEGQPKVVRAAYIVAFTYAGLSSLSVILGPSISLFGAAICLIGGLGIRSGRTWSAYGFALYLAAQTLAGIAILSAGETSTSTVEVVAAVILALPLLTLSILAGRRLSKIDESRGAFWPWLVLAGLTTVPLVFWRVWAIPTGAMEDTLLIGDRIIATRHLGLHPAFGSVVVFRSPQDPSTVVVKRVIGLPGDRIKIVNKRVFRNGTELDEPYAKHTTSFTDSFRDNFPSEPTVNFSPRWAAALKENSVNGELVVPLDDYFTLGDNRDNSLDSRYFGFVPSGDILGEPILVLYSERQVAEPGRPKTAQIEWGLVRWDRFLKRL